MFCSSVERMSSPILSAKFYGISSNKLCNDLDQRVEKALKQRPVELHDKPRSILLPLRYKKEFWRQNDALLDAAERTKDDEVLCCFVFQDENERRRFIVTYPEDLWEDFQHVPLARRVFYEVIPEHSPCFLYYDLEFETELNKEKNGIEITRTLIDITCEYLAKYWNYTCDRSMVINLDSSRDGKFSKHLIFSTKDVAFENNSHVGQLVKMICLDTINFMSCENAEHDILNKFNKADLQELFVETNKGKKLFIDVNVYSKNRHFRIYKATKWGKNSHLIHASDCEYKWDKKPKNKDMDIFVNSLISYLPNKKKMRLLSFDQNKKAQTHRYSLHAETRLTQSVIYREQPKSPYPALDNYISDLVKPGRIRDSKFVENMRLIIFEIIGNRYCNNIGRWHKSNNVYYLVDLIKKVMYQKCHDEDCAGFCSDPIQLPTKVTFFFEDETDHLFSALDS